MTLPTLRTARLIMRPWREEDLEPFAQMNADSQVTRYLPGRLSRRQSDALAERIVAEAQQHGLGLWALQVPGGPGFAGFTGLSVKTFPAPFTPCVEVGWRLARAHWGHGYATEAATASLAQAFGPLGLDGVVSMTVVDNLASRRVMERVGMLHDPAEDFDHPQLPAGSPLRRHVLYRLDAGRWLTRRA